MMKLNTKNFFTDGDSEIRLQESRYSLPFTAPNLLPPKIAALILPTGAINLQTTFRYTRTRGIRTSSLDSD
jgi:hypothetical protein